ncbi:MAG: response regulator [Cyclobacteriaceae bacterium]
MSIPHQKSANADGPLGRGLNILLVDDDDICLFIHRRVLELSGHCASARSAGNGKSALEILHRPASGKIPVPDLILLDLEMPIMNGITFLEEFQRLDHAHHHRIAIVLLTSSVSEKDKQYAMSLGVSHYLSKPFTLEAFNTVVHSLYKVSSPLPLINNVLVTKKFRNSI